MDANDLEIEQNLKRYRQLSNDELIAVLKCTSIQYTYSKNVEIAGILEKIVRDPVATRESQRIAYVIFLGVICAPTHMYPDLSHEFQANRDTCNALLSQYTSIAGRIFISIRQRLQSYFEGPDPLVRLSQQLRNQVR